MSSSRSSSLKGDDRPSPRSLANAYIVNATASTAQVSGTTGSVNIKVKTEEIPRSRSTILQCARSHPDAELSDDEDERSVFTAVTASDSETSIDENGFTKSDKAINESVSVVETTHTELPASPERTLNMSQRQYLRKGTDARFVSTRDVLLKKYIDAGSQTVTFNVGGTFFVTTINTLLKEPDSLFVKILDREESAIRAHKQIFLDRNPKHFSALIDYMRTGYFLRDENGNILRGVLNEAEFFKIRSLAKILKDLPEFSRADLIKMRNSCVGSLSLRGMWLKNINLSGMDLNRCVLDFANVSNGNLRNASLYMASIVHATFEETNMYYAVLEAAVIANTNFTGANLSNCNMKDVVAKGSNFTRANLTSSSFEGADLSGAVFYEADLSGCDFTGANLENADLRGAIFTEDTVMRDATTAHADFEGSNVGVAAKFKENKFGTFRKKKNKKDDSKWGMAL